MPRRLRQGKCRLANVEHEFRRRHEGIRTGIHPCRAGMVGAPFDNNLDAGNAGNGRDDTDILALALQNRALFDMEFEEALDVGAGFAATGIAADLRDAGGKCARSDEPTPELQSLMRKTYAVFCLTKTKSSFMYI